MHRTGKPDYREILGIRVTICNYNEYQLEPGLEETTEGKDVRTTNRTGRRTKTRTDERTAGGTGGRIFNNNEDEKGRSDKNIIREKEPANHPADNSITPETAIQIWNELRGPLPEVTTGYDKETQNVLVKLAEYFNRRATNGQSPITLFRDFVTKAATTTQSEHYSTVRLMWLAQKPSHIDQVNDGVFAKSYNKSGDDNGRTNRSRGSSKGSLDAYRRKDEESEGGRFRIDSPTKM